MSSTIIGALGGTFSVALLVGLWAEEAEHRSPSDLGVSEWVPAALGLLRAELVVLLGLMVLLVLQPVSWVPFAALVVMAALVGRVVHAARPTAVPVVVGGWRGAGGAVACGCRGVPACDRAARCAGWGCVPGDGRRLLGPQRGAVRGWRGGRRTVPSGSAW